MQLANIQQKLDSVHTQSVQNHTQRVSHFQVEGKQDGELELPRDDSSAAMETEDEIRNLYQSEIDNLEEEGMRLLDEPRFLYKQLLSQKDDLLKNLINIRKEKIETALENKNRKLLEAKKNYDHEIERITDDKKNIERKLHEAEGNFDKISKEQNRNGKPQLFLKSSVIEWSLLIFIGLCEIPLNYVVFSNFLLPKIETYILSCLLVIAVPICAHYSGIVIRQWDEKKHYEKKKTLFFVVNSILLALTIAVGVMRTEYIKEVLKYSPNEWTIITFILLSYLLYLVGIIISYLHHDNSQQYTDAYFTLLEAQNIRDRDVAPLIVAVRKEEDSYSSLVDQYESEFHQIKKEIDDLVNDMDKSILDTVHYHDQILNTFKALEKEVNSNYKICIAKYRTENRRSRRNGHAPACWKEPLDLKFVFALICELDSNN